VRRTTGKKVVAGLPRSGRRDRGAAAQAVIGERCLLAGQRHVGNRDEAVLGVPEVIALPVGGEVAVGVVAERHAGEAHQLVEVVVARRLGRGRGALEQSDVAGRIEGVPKRGRLALLGAALVTPLERQSP
jgi:hypothetical protein